MENFPTEWKHLPGEEEKEEGHKFIEYVFESEAFCSVLRYPISLDPHADPVREV